MPQFVHIVILKFKDGVGEEQISSIFSSLESLFNNKTISGLLSYSGGPYSSPEGLNKGFTHGFTMTFADEASRNNYFPHPDHESIKNAIIPIVDDVVAFDYSMQNKN